MELFPKISRVLLTRHVQPQLGIVIGDQIAAQIDRDALERPWRHHPEGMIVTRRDARIIER